MNIYLIPVLTIIAAWIAVSLPLYFILLPRQLQSVWKALSTEISKMILAELNTTNVVDKLLNPTALANLSPTIETHIDQFLKVKLLEKMPFLSTFLGESTLAKLKAGMMEEIELLLPEVVEEYISKASSQVNISDFVQEKLNNVDTNKLVKSIRTALSGKIAVMKWTAIIVGAAVGIIQLMLLSI